MESGPWLVANWKMNGGVRDLEAWSRMRLSSLNSRFDRIVVCPPAVLLYPLAAALEATGIELGAQDCHPQPSGAFTGSVSAEQIAESGAQLVIVGHSERRGALQETDALVRAKGTAALRAGLEPVVCVGETLDERNTGKTAAVVTAQTQASLPLSSGPTTVAYEPAWAIGTGLVPGAEEIRAAVAAIREAVRSDPARGPVRILYGGSVSAATVGGLLDIPGVDGVLVGGAALTSEGLTALLAAPSDPGSLDRTNDAA